MFALQLSLRRVMTSVRLLRYHYGCQLPAEVFHFQDEQPSESVLKELEALNVSVLALNTLKMQSDNRAYHLKASAILESSFREVLFLDSDNFPAADLTPLFESKAYQRLGATFWPDYWKESPVNPIWQIIGVQCRDEFSQESGIFLIDKNVHLDVLRLVEWMLEHRNYFYKLSMGDKDLFRFAMLALRKRWAVPGRHRVLPLFMESVRHADADKGLSDSEHGKLGPRRARRAFLWDDHGAARHQRPARRSARQHGQERSFLNPLPRGHRPRPNQSGARRFGSLGTPQMPTTSTQITWPT